MRRKNKFLFPMFFITAFSMIAATAGEMTPLDWYSSDKAKNLAKQYDPLIQEAFKEITTAYAAEDLRPVKLDESAVGAGGFWKNPAKFQTENRYMGMIVMAKTPPYIFGNDRNGHVASVLDRYGKSMLTALTKQMEKANGVDGVVLCIVWGNSVNGKPSQAGTEALALFLAREDVIMYKNFKLTIEALVNRNDLFLFNGAGEIDNLLQFILES